jgi:hypothetical protein
MLCLSPWQAHQRDAYCATMFPNQEVQMEHRAPSSSVVSSAQASPTVNHEGRGTWILTAYGISGLAVFGVLLYYFATYITH